MVVVVVVVVVAAAAGVVVVVVVVAAAAAAAAAVAAVAAVAAAERQQRHAAGSKQPAATMPAAELYRSFFLPKPFSRRGCRRLTGRACEPWLCSRRMWAFTTMGGPDTGMSLL